MRSPGVLFVAIGKEIVLVFFVENGGDNENQTNPISNSQTYNATRFL